MNEDNESIQIYDEYACEIHVLKWQDPVMNEKLKIKSIYRNIQNEAQYG